MKYLVLTIMCLLLLITACRVQVAPSGGGGGGQNISNGDICQGKADDRNLSGAERAAYIEGCMTCQNPGVSQNPTAQRQQHCENMANNKGYTAPGPQRRGFLAGCLDCH
ncbi:MAG: hypothetical protein D6E12_11660 [Desulfovibrio sp.]|nr:MAG: hypothetical protein D6E12_11660 [Desulfovibrio sp.]